MAGLCTRRFSTIYWLKSSYKPLGSLSCFGSLGLLPYRRQFSTYLVSPKDLNDALKTSDETISSEGRIVPLCAAWFPADSPKGWTGIQTFLEKRIANARYFDLDKVIDAHPPYPHVLPGEVSFASSLSELGIRKEDVLVVYDSAELGILSAPKVGWMLKAFGHPKVHILNNFRLWVEQGLPTEQGNVENHEYYPYPIPELDETRLASLDDIQRASMIRNKEEGGDTQILDSRPCDQYSGIYQELHLDSLLKPVPGSIHIPCESMLDSETKAFLPSGQLQKLFEMMGIDPERPIISTGAGITVYMLDAALKQTKFSSSNLQRVYDGSWNEWTTRVRAWDYLFTKSQQ